MILAHVIGRQLLVAGTEILLCTERTFQAGTDVGHIDRHTVGSCHVNRVGVNDFRVVTIFCDGYTADGAITAKFRLRGVAFLSIVCDDNNIRVGVRRVFTDDFKAPGSQF